MYLEMRDTGRYLDTEPARSTFAMAIFLPLLATIAVIARFYARYWKKVKPGWDDWLVIVALASYCSDAMEFTAYIC